MGVAGWLLVCWLDGWLDSRCLAAAGWILSALCGDTAELSSGWSGGHGTGGGALTCARYGGSVDESAVGRVGVAG